MRARSTPLLFPCAHSDSRLAAHGSSSIPFPSPTPRSHGNREWEQTSSSAVLALGVRARLKRGRARFAARMAFGWLASPLTRQAECVNRSLVWVGLLSCSMPIMPAGWRAPVCY